MFYFMFTDYCSIAVFPALISGLGLILFTTIYLLYAGSSIRRQAGVVRLVKRLILLRFMIMVSTSICVLSLFVLLFGELAIVRTYSPAPPLPDFLTTLIGAPATVDNKRLLAFAGLMLMTIFFANIFIFAQTKSGSSLRLWLDHFRAISRTQEEYGSSHFASPQEYRRFRLPVREGIALYGKFLGKQLSPKKYTYLGDRFCLSAEDASRGILTLGNPGSGKSTSVILPMIYDSMQSGHNLVLADPQNELTPHILSYARITEHRIILHDPTHPQSPGFNLAQGIRNVSDARAVADVLIPKGHSGTDSFWSQSAEMLLAACLLRFDNLADIFASFGDLKTLGKVLNSIPDDAQRLAGSFINSTRSDLKLATNIVATLSTSLSAWADDAICESTLYSDFSAKSLVNPKQPTLIILACPAKHRRVIAPYLGAVLTRLLLDLDAYAETQAEGLLPVPVRFIMDEFPTLGDLSVVVEFAHLVRKRQIGFLIAAQTLGQLEAIYGKNGSDTLLAGLAFQIIFGGCDQRTADYYSRATGTSTHKQATGKNLPQPSRARTLLTPDEIIRPPQGNCLIFGRYVTAEYATYLIVLSRLTRIYEREDVKSLVTASKNRKLKRLRRKAVSLKAKRFRQVDTGPPIRPLCSIEDLTAIQEEKS